VTEARTFVEEARREKLEQLVALGVPAYAYGFERTHTAVEALEAFRPDEDIGVRCAGRIVSRRDDLGRDAYELVKLLDLGDVVGVGGYMFQTRTGEITIHAEDVMLLAKALRPPPIGKEDAAGTQHGTLTDTELRYRQRYADLMVHPEQRDVFRIRADTIRYLRAFLDGRGYLEVETPVLQPIYGGALARPFTTHHNALDARFYLRNATE
jgi:lysyl-tRNA synthetase class 2